MKKIVGLHLLVSSTEIPKDDSEYETQGKTPKGRTAIKVETAGYGTYQAEGRTHM
jgi:hypothetical protein